MDLQSFIMQVGIENIWCKTHNRPMADSLSRAYLSGRHNKPKFFCDRCLESVTVDDCIFVRKEVQDGS